MIANGFGAASIASKGDLPEATAFDMSLNDGNDGIPPVALPKGNVSAGMLEPNGEGGKGDAAAVAATGAALTRTACALPPVVRAVTMVLSGVEER